MPVLDDQEWWALYRKLLAVCYRQYRLSPDDSHDHAMNAMIAATEHDAMNLSYAAECVRNAVIYERKKSPRRNDVELGEDEERLHNMPAPQVLRLVCSETVAALDVLPVHMREPMRLAAIGNDTCEIASHLNMSQRLAKDTISRARAILRSRDLYDLPPKRGHQRFFGIKKAGRKWKAYVNVGNDRTYVGSFESASEAAAAYDKRAKELLGDRAKLNSSLPQDERE